MKLLKACLKMTVSKGCHSERSEESAFPLRVNSAKNLNLKSRWPTFFLVAFLLLSPSFLRAESLDSRWYHQIHDRWHSSTLDPVMKAATNAGEATPAIAVCLAVETFGRKREKESAKLGVVALGASGLVTELLKGAVNRQRPDGNTSGRWDSSFPSGHATGAFAAALITAERYHKLAIPAYLGATVVGLSRIYLGRHYPSDVAAGAAIGTASAILVLKFQKPILKFEL